MDLEGSRTRGLIERDKSESERLAERLKRTYGLRDDNVIGTIRLSKGGCKP